MTNFFTGAELAAWLDSRLQEAMKRVDSFDPARLKFAPDEVAQQVARDFLVEQISLDWDHLRRSEPRETKLRVRNFGEAVSVDGRAITVYVPVNGPAQVLQKRASTFWLGGYPDVCLYGAELAYEIAGRDLTAEQVTASVKMLREKLDQAVAWVNDDTSKWCERLLPQLQQRAQRRKQALDANDQLSAALDIPVRAAQDAPEIVPMRATELRPAPPKPFEPQVPEPQLAAAVYEQIVEKIRTVGNTAERLPATSAKFDEEEWRDLLLFILNANFEGELQGEAFNGSGKTDLLLRFRDKNAFIGECKFWSGQKAFGDAIDQLLGYTVWRDSKAALILFIRNKDATAVINKADAVLRDHHCFIQARVAKEPESRRDYLVHAVDDAERTISLALLPIVVRVVQRDTEPPESPL